MAFGGWIGVSNTLLSTQGTRSFMHCLSKRDLHKYGGEQLVRKDAVGVLRYLWSKPACQTIVVCFRIRNVAAAQRLRQRGLARVSDDENEPIRRIKSPSRSRQFSLTAAYVQAHQRALRGTGHNLTPPKTNKKETKIQSFQSVLCMPLRLKIDYLLPSSSGAIRLYESGAFSAKSY